MKTTVEIDLTPLNLAEAFCEMADENQAQFFIECTTIMGRWGSHRRDMQLHYIGRHLRTCECSTESTRDFVRAIAEEATRHEVI